MSLSCYLPRKGQLRGISFQSLEENSKKNRILLGLSCSKDKVYSYCSLRKKQMIAKQEDLKKTQSKQKLQQEASHLSYFLKSNKKKQDILKVTPAVMYQSLRNKKILQRNRIATQPSYSPELQRAKTQNWQSKNIPKQSLPAFNSFKKTKWTDIRKTTIDPQSFQEIQSEKRPFTADISANRLKTLDQELPRSQVQLFFDSLRGWQTKYQYDDL